MPKVTYTKADRDEQKKVGLVLVTLAVDGTGTGSSYRDYQNTGRVTPAVARELVRAFEDIIAKAESTQAP